MGVVTPKPKTPEEEYPIAVGPLRVKFRNLNIGKITTEKVVEKSFEVYNSADAAWRIDDGNTILPKHISIRLEKDSIPAKALGTLLVAYDPIMKNDYGFVSDNITIDTTEKGILSVMAIIEEFFPEMTAEELDNSARLEISQQRYDFGTVSQGTLLEKTIELTNIGKSHLEFRAIKSNCDCVSYEIKSKRIKKGKSQSLKITFDTSEMRGNQYKSVTIYSNDPVRPTQIININGKVEK